MEERRNVENRGMSPKYWADLSLEEKAERLRIRLKMLQTSYDLLLVKVVQMEHHQHDSEGVPFVRYELGKDLFTGIPPLSPNNDLFL